MAGMRPRPWDEDERSRSRDSKTPRLDLLAETATAAAEVDDDDLLGPELTGGGDDDDDGRCCDHVPTDSAHKDILSWSLLSDDAGTCKDCRSEAGSGDGGPKYRLILVCLECGRHSCGDSWSYFPCGHAWDHAKQEQHWVAALFDDPQTGFCFKCECERPVYPEPDDDELGTIAGEIHHAGSGGGGHAFGFDMPIDLAAGLLDLGDAWRAAAELGSIANAQGYAIRGIPNRGNTCYMNAIVQCLLALDELRARMLGPDPPPTGDLGMALRELFVEASSGDAAGLGMLNPNALLRSVRLYSSKYEAYEMHDSYELLESLRNALQDEERGIETLDREEGGALTVIDSIFRGEMSETRSCVYCQSASTFHGHFWDLSLSLPSEENLCKSFASSAEASKNIKSQPKKVVDTQLLSSSESNGLGMMDSKSGGSHLLVPELNDLVAENTSEPMEVDFAEEQRTLQSNDVIHYALYTEEPLHCVGFVPHGTSDATIEQMIQMATHALSPEDMGPPPLVSPISEHDVWTSSDSYVDQNGKGIWDNSCIPTIEDCLSLFFKEEVVERNCDCSKVPMEPSTNQSRKGKQMEVGNNDRVVEQSDWTTCPNGQSSELVSLSVEGKFSYCRQQYGFDGDSEIIQMVDTNSRMSCDHKETGYHDGIEEATCSFLSTEKHTNLLSTQYSQNLIPPNQNLRKRVWLDLSANHLGDNQNEQKERSECAIQRLRIMKLPPVLTLHLKRYINNGNEYHKNEVYVSYKEHLDVGQFMDSSYVGKHNAIYRLAGLVEHRGGPFMNVGHYVAYVRARNIRNHHHHQQQQQSNWSSSWFCADDSNIREVTIEEVLQRKPYVLFYERMEHKI